MGTLPTGTGYPALELLILTFNGLWVDSTVQLISFYVVSYVDEIVCEYFIYQLKHLPAKKSAEK